MERTKAEIMDSIITKIDNLQEIVERLENKINKSENTRVEKKTIYKMARKGFFKCVDILHDSPVLLKWVNGAIVFGIFVGIGYAMANIHYLF